MNDLDESKKSKQKRPTMKYYQPRSTNAVKRSDSLNGSNGSNSNSDDNNMNNSKLNDLHFDDKNSNSELKLKEDSTLNDRKKTTATKLREDKSYENNLIDSFNKTVTLNEKPRNSHSQPSASKNSPQPNSDDEFSNMLEIYDLSPDLKSQGKKHSF